MEQIGLQPKAGLARTAAADEQDIFVPRRFRVFGAAIHRQPLRLRENDVVLKCRIDVGLDVLGGSPTGAAVLQIFAKFLGVFALDIDRQPNGDGGGNALLKHGYTIKIFNTINFQKSMHYNPFAYIHSEKDILKLVTTLIANTKGDGKAGDEFWTKAETLLYCALIGYIHYEAPVEEQNFSTLIEFLNAMEVREDDEEFQNPVDLMFEALEKKKPNHFAVRQYKKYKLAAGKTAKSILISCGARLAVFDIAELREVTSYDELELDTLGDRKTALFLIMSDTDDSFNFLISMCYTCLLYTSRCV